MTKEMKQVFTRRITQANRTQLVVIVYEMLLVYLDEAASAYQKGDTAEFGRSLQFARDCIGNLRENLNFSYGISKNLFAIYNFADRELASNISGNRAENLNAIRIIFKKLLKAYQNVSKKDNSAPLMDNIQSVYAGLTYNKKTINESLVSSDVQRGYLVQGKAEKPVHAQGENHPWVCLVFLVPALMMLVVAENGSVSTQN